MYENHTGKENVTVNMISARGMMNSTYLELLVKEEKEHRNLRH